MDHSEFAELYERHLRRVYSYCRRRTSADAAEDAVAETFLTAWSKSDEIPDGDEALPWLFAVAYRVLGHQWRGASRQSRLQRKLTSIGVSPVEMPEDFIVTRQESQKILEALSMLSQDEQEILRLTAWEELQHRDIARVLDLSVDAVKKRASRARKRLAREYDRLDRNPTSSAARERGAW